MFEVINKFLNWLLPDRATRRYILDELRTEVTRLTEQLSVERQRIESYEERIKKLEERFEKESCLRFGCKHRLSFNELQASEAGNSATTGDTCSCSQN